MAVSTAFLTTSFNQQSIMMTNHPLSSGLTAATHKAVAGCLNISAARRRGPAYPADSITISYTTEPT